MTTAQGEVSTAQRSLRLWPGVVIVALQWLLRFVAPVIVPAHLAPQAMMVGVMGALVCTLALIVWWVFFSRAPWSERLGAMVLIALAVAITPLLLHESIATGAMGLMFYIYATPVLCLALVAWAVATRNLSDRTRRLALVAAIILACGVWTLFRTEGMTGSAGAQFKWRWTQTPEELLLAEVGEDPSVPSAAAIALGTEAEWPGFRGPNRDGVVRGVQIDTDWSASPPVEIWRQPIGPGWSSFAVHGDFIYTQEQRGEEEVVSCYRRATGEPVWKHRDAVRFWESNAGPGPRATPTLSGGRVYALGATGLLNVLDAADGSVVWSRNAAADTETEVPMWAFSGSPLVVDDLVLVPTAGTLIAYDRETGEPRWTGPEGGDGYSSPHRATLGGVEQVIQVGSQGVTSFNPADGSVLWSHEWPGYPIVQPALTGDGDILIGVTDRSGLRRLAIDQGPEGWSAEERWTSIRLKPYFNDFVVHEGHAYGFDGSILACMDLENGERVWKGGRYGNGQLILLANQDLLLVVSEKGELALVNATTDRFTELARFPAIEGKTWNHPVLVDDLLLVRNDQEMAAFRLTLSTS